MLGMMAFPRDVWGSHCGIPTEQPIEGWGPDPHGLSLEGTDIPGFLFPRFQKHLHPKAGFGVGNHLHGCLCTAMGQEVGGFCHPEVGLW